MKENVTKREREENEAGKRKEKIDSEIVRELNEERTKYNTRETKR